MKYYKWFAGRSPIYGKGEYVLDGGWQPKIEGELELCENGYHVCTEEQLPFWRGTRLAEVEVDAAGMAVGDEKCAVHNFRVVRWLCWGELDLIDCAKSDASAAERYAAAARDVASFARTAADAARDVASFARTAAASTAASTAACYAASFARAAADAFSAERMRQKNWILDRVAENENREKKGEAR